MKNCGARGIRTPDLFHAMEARYQLRHSPVKGVPLGVHSEGIVELGGFEPPTSSMPWKRATNCAIAPSGRRSRAATRITVWRLAPSGQIRDACTTSPTQPRILPRGLGSTGGPAFHFTTDQPGGRSLVRMSA